MPLETQIGIDKAQTQIDNLDGSADKKVVKDSKDYAEQFLRRVDALQDKIDNLNAPKDLREEHLKKLLTFLQGVDANNIERAANTLDSKLIAFIAQIDNFSNQQRSKYEIQKGDYLSTIAQHCFDKEGRQLRWQDLYTANQSQLRSGDPNRIYPGEKLNIPNRYSYFNSSDLPQLEIKPPEPGQKPAEEQKPVETKAEVRKSDTVQEKQPVEKGGTEAEGLTIETACKNTKQEIEAKLESMKSSLPLDQYKTLEQAYENLIKSKSNSVDKEPSQELLDNLKQFSQTLDEIESQIKSQETSGEILDHGEIEKTIVRAIRKVPFLANFTPVGMVTGLINSTLGVENASAKEKAIEGAKFVASIIPVAGNFVDLAEGIYGLITGKRMGTDIPQTTGEALFSIGIGIGGLAIDVLTLGTMGAPIKAAFKAGWKIGLKKLPGLILKGAKDYIAKEGLKALQKPLGAFKDAGVWLGETFVAGPAKFVWKAGKAVVFDAPKLALQGAKEFIKSPIQTSKKAIESVTEGAGSLWNKTKTWWKNRGEEKNKTAEERVADVKTKEQEKLANLEDQNSQLNTAIEAKQKEIAGLEGGEKATAEKELAEMQKRQSELTGQIENKKIAIEGVDKVSAEVKANLEKKVQKIEGDITKRGEFLKEISTQDITHLSIIDLNGARSKIDGEIKQIDSLLANPKDLPDETISSLRHQQQKLTEAKGKYDTECNSRVEYSRKYFTEQVNSISESIKNLLSGISKPNINLDEIKNASRKIGEMGAVIGALKNKLPNIPDINLRQKFHEQISRLEVAYAGLKKRFEAKVDELKKNDDFSIERRFDSIDEIATNRLDEAKIIEGQNGKIVYGTDEGVNYKEWNEDAQVINTDKNAFASIDGMGGMGHGDKAARILAEEMQKGFRDGSLMEQIQMRAHQRMQAEGIGQGGACYVAGKITENRLDIYQAGDVKLIIVGKDGSVRFATRDEGQGHIVHNAVQGDDAGKTTHSSADLQAGDRIIAASDGLWDNFTPEQIARMVSGKSPEDAIKLINDQTKEKMRSGNGKPDNINVIIYDFEKQSPVKQEHKIDIRDDMSYRNSIEAQIGELKAGDVIISHSGTKRTITSVQGDNFIVATEKNGVISQETLGKNELTAENNEWVREIKKAESNHRAMSVNEEVYVKRSNGSVEKGWFVEKINSDGSYALRNPEKGLTRNTSQNEIWSLKEIEGRGSGDLLKDDVALLEKRKLEILDQYTSLSKKQFDSMFGSWNAIRQQNVGNCYLIASLNSLRESPHFEVLVRTSIKEVRGGWEVKVPLGSPNARSVFITKEDLKPQPNPKYNRANRQGEVDTRKYLDPVDAPMGYKVLEAAFIKQVLGGVLDRSKIEGGFGHQSLLSLLGNNFEKVKVSGSDRIRDPRHTHAQYGESPAFIRGTELGRSNLVNFLDSYDNAKFIATANTPSSAIGDRGRFKINGIEFATGHAYSIVNVDKFNKNVFVANPWDTSKVIKLSYDEFMQVFNQVSAVEVRHKQLIENFDRIKKAV